MFKNIIKFILFFGLNGLALYFPYIFMQAGQPIFMSVCVLLILLSNLVFLFKKAYPYRYLYPSFLTFFLFMLIPIFYTLYVAFTNMGTGHMLSANQSREMLLQEEIVADNAPELPAYILRSNQADQKLIYYMLLVDRTVNKALLKTVINIEELKTSGSEALVQHQNLEIAKSIDSQLSVTDDELVNSYITDHDLSIVPKYELVSHLTVLKQLSLKFNDTVYQLHNISSFIEKKKRFKSLDSLALEEVDTQKVFVPDFNTGFFTCNEQTLSPGFRTTIGFDNFIKLFKSEQIVRPFLEVFLWTIVWALLSVFFSFSVGIMLALSLNVKTLRFRVVYRILLIIPYSIPFFISVLTFKLMLNRDFGVINQFLFDVFSLRIPWLTEGIWAKVSVITVNVWLGFPYMMLLSTGILQSIPSDIYEAAAIDGAGKIRSFFQITLPMIISAIAPMLIGSFAFNFNNFVGIYLLTGGGPAKVGAVTPAGETDILLSYTYRLAFEGQGRQDFGLASAIGVIIFIIIAVVTVVNLRLSKASKALGV